MSRTRPAYPEEFRREAVALVRRSPGRSVPEIAKELGISDQSLRNWVKQAEIDRGARRGLSVYRCGEGKSSGRRDVLGAVGFALGVLRVGVSGAV